MCTAPQNAERFDESPDCSYREKRKYDIINNGFLGEVDNNAKNRQSGQIAMPWVREERGYGYGLFWHNVVRIRRGTHLS